MNYGIVNLSVISQRSGPSDPSEIVNQLLFGEVFEVLEEQEKWVKVRSAIDNYEGYIDRKHWTPLDEQDYNNIDWNGLSISQDLLADVQFEGRNMKLPAGSIVNRLNDFPKSLSDSVVEITERFIGVPYLWGGKTLMGIDCSGLTQIAFRCCGIRIPRDASQQVNEGQQISFVEETRSGDLAFFDNEKGAITHVGVVVRNDDLVEIIHASGHVRKDKLDHHGIFNRETGDYSHSLRTIKRIH